MTNTFGLPQDLGSRIGIISDHITNVLMLVGLILGFIHQSIQRRRNAKKVDGVKEAVDTIGPAVAQIKLATNGRLSLALRDAAELSRELYRYSHREEHRVRAENARLLFEEHQRALNDTSDKPFDPK